jgi:N-methylhydantoinase B
MKNKTQDTDPVTTEIIRNALNSIAKEMNESLFRSAYTPIIFEMKDCSVAIYDKDYQLLGQSAGLPLFLGNLEVGIRLAADYFGRDSFKPGDVYVLNDSYMVGTHLNDITVFAPIFHNNKLVGYSANRAHWLDIGSKDPGYPMDSTEIYQEGIRIPPLKIIDNGKPREDVIDTLILNNRFHRAARGDLQAQIAACNVGELRLNELLDRFGYQNFKASTGEIFENTEAIDREKIAAIADGVYRDEGYLDNDGLSSDPIKVCVEVQIEGDEITIDLEGSSPAVKGPVNCGFAQTKSACRVAFKGLIDPDSPVNGGNFRNLKIKAPKGTIFYAEEPTPCAWYFTPLGLLIDMIVNALSSELPNRAVAAHYGDSMVITFSGNDDGPFLNVEATAGGWGGYPGNDGESALINAVNGDFHNLPIEVLEQKFPLQIHRYSIRRDSEGVGRFRGGCGVIREYEVLSDEASLSLWFDRSKTPAWGIMGGESANGPDVIIKSPEGEEIHLLKCNARSIKSGSKVTVLTGGGGGCQKPIQREIESVRDDVLDGYISLERARSVYGVVLNDKNEINLTETQKLRA